MTHRILVTGGAGYLGSIMVPELLAAGHRVTVLDNFMYRQNGLAHVCNSSAFDVVNGDIRSEDSMKRLLKDADIVIPLAALVGAPLCNKDPVGATTINHDAILMMLRHVSPQQAVLMPYSFQKYRLTSKSSVRKFSRYNRQVVSTV